MDRILDKIEAEIRGALVDKSYACVYLQQVIRVIGNSVQSMVSDGADIIMERENSLRLSQNRSAFRQRQIWYGPMRRRCLKN